MPQTADELQPSRFPPSTVEDQAGASSVIEPQPNNDIARQSLWRHNAQALDRNKEARLSPHSWIAGPEPKCHPSLARCTTAIALLSGQRTVAGGPPLGPSNTVSESARGATGLRYLPEPRTRRIQAARPDRCTGR